MHQLTKSIIVVVALLFANNSLAVLNWYYGKVTRIYAYSNGFVLTLDSTALGDCIHSYVYFNVSTLGDQTVNRAYSMALTAHTTGKTFGVVIDKAINGPGGVCSSNGSTDIKD